MLRSYLCDFNDAYISVTGNINVIKKIFTTSDFERPNNTNLNAISTNNANNNEFGEKKLVSFINCISEINGIKIDNAEDLDVASLCIIYLSIVKIIEKQQVVYGIIIEMNQIVVQIIII